MAHREIALGRRHPQIGAPCVKDHRKVLRRRADADLSEVLSVHVILEGDNLATVRPVRSVRPVWTVRPVLEPETPLQTAILRAAGETRGEPAGLVQWPLSQPDLEKAVRRGRKRDGGQNGDEKARRENSTQPHRASSELGHHRCPQKVIFFTAENWY